MSDLLEPKAFKKSEKDVSAEKDFKNEVFMSFFDKRVIDYPVSKGGQNVNTYLAINDGRLVKHFEGLKNKYGFKRSWLDLQSEYIFQSWEAISKFESIDWQGILDRTNELEVNKLIKYIKQTVTYKIYEYANPDAFRTTTTEEGKRVHYTLVVDFESLDNLLNQEIEDGSISSVQLTDENNVFNNTMYYYYVSFFQKWFEENKKNILAKSQVKFLEDLKKCSSKPHLTAEEFEEVTGVKWNDYSRRLRKIEDRILREWKKARPKQQSRKQVFNEPVLEYFRNYLNIVKDTSVLRAQNLLLTNHLIDGMNQDNVEYDVFTLVNDVLKGEELIEFNRLVNSNNHKDVALSASSLYKITEKVEERLLKLEKAQEEPVEEKKVQKKANDEKKKKKHSEVLTFNKEGKLLKHEFKLEQEYIKHKNIYYLLPTGVQTRV